MSSADGSPGGQPMSRREARQQQAQAMPDDRGGQPATEVMPTPVKPARKNRVRLVVLVAVGLLVLAVVWVGIRASIVYNELQAAQRVVNHIQDDGTLSVSVPILGERAASAASVRYDPVWRAAEVVPWVGQNLKGARLTSEALDVMANELGGPIIEEIGSDSDQSILERVLPALQNSSDDIERIASDVTDLRDSWALLPEVRTAVGLVDSVMQLAAPAVEFAPELLGANGSRTYLMVFQNNAESVGLGGSAASQTLITADQGQIEITNQASSGDYVEGQAVGVEVAQSALDLYTEFLVTHINTSSSRPDFPTMAEIVTAFWQRDIADDQIDGVISIDPIALSYVLGATGPVQLQTGDVLTQDNAVTMLLSGAYARYTPEETDIFFASVANEVFTKVSAGDFDMQGMLNAIRAGIDGGNVLFHSSNEDVQAQLADERASGILPTDNEDASVVGVYFRDESASKIDYYMKSNIDVTQTCDAGTTRFTTATTLHLDIDQATADALPDYVKSQTWGTSQFRTQVYVYGPPGTSVESVEVAGERVELARDDVVDLDRPVAWFTTYLAPTELATVSATFVGEGDFGPAELRHTPMVRGTTGTITPCE